LNAENTSSLKVRSAIISSSSGTLPLAAESAGLPIASGTVAGGEEGAEERIGMLFLRG
jgi:hypothetical protein